MKIEDEKSFAELTDKEYKYGFVTDIESDSLPPGLSNSNASSTVLCWPAHS